MTEQKQQPEQSENQQQQQEQSDAILENAREEDPNVAAIRASQFLYRVLTQCSQRLGFSALTPSPLKIEEDKSGIPISVLFSKYAEHQCRDFLEFFELERRAAEARHKLMRLSLKTRFREKSLDNRIEEKRLDVWEKRVRETQRERYRGISGTILTLTSKLIVIRSKLRQKNCKITPLELDLREVFKDIAGLQQQFAETSKVEFQLEAQLMRLILVENDSRKIAMEKLTKRHQSPSMFSHSNVDVDVSSSHENILLENNNNHQTPQQHQQRTLPQTDHDIPIVETSDHRFLVGISRFDHSPHVDNITTPLSLPVRKNWVRHEHQKKNPMLLSTSPTAAAATTTTTLLRQQQHQHHQRQQSPSRLGLRGTNSNEVPAGLKHQQIGIQVKPHPVVTDPT